MELPAGSPALLGVIPLESVGLEPDVRNQTLRLLPEGPDRSHIMMLQQTQLLAISSQLSASARWLTADG